MCITLISVDITNVEVVRLPCAKQKKLLDSIHRAKVIKDKVTGYNGLLHLLIHR